MNKQTEETKYALLLPNQEALAYYRYTNLKQAKKDAQLVANGWHEIVEIAAFGGGEKFKIVERVKPKTEVALVPTYSYGGNRTWSMEWKQDR